VEDDPVVDKPVEVDIPVVVDEVDEPVDVDEVDEPVDVDDPVDVDRPVDPPVAPVEAVDV
jgi:hypothetical protein